MKKILSLLLALLMIVSLLSVAAFADGDTDPTEDPPPEGGEPTEDPAGDDGDDGEKTAPLADRTHTYTAYQIFSGTQTDGEDADLGAVVWGSGIDSANFLAELISTSEFGTSNPFKGCVAVATETTPATTAAEVAAILSAYEDNSDVAKAFAKIAENHVIGNGTTVVNGQTELDAGYYLVVDTTSSIEADDAYNVALLQLTKKDTFAIVPKNSVPEVIKKINNGLTCTKLDPDAENYDDKHEHTKECYDWSDANNVAIGDTVNFRIETAVPATVTEYEYYFFIINDTLSKGLTYDAENPSIKVYIDGKLATAADYTVKVTPILDTKDQPTGETNIQIALVDAIANAGKSVVVTYDATLNEDAIIGVEGNPNKVTVDYSNNPNEDYESGTKPTDGFPKDTTHTPKGETPADYTITYSTELKVYKVDGDGNSLQGAEFTLYGDGLNVALVFTEQFTEDKDGTYFKLTDGTYTTEAPITEEKMEAAEEGATEGYVEDSTYTGEDKVVIGDKTYRPYVPETDSSKTIYVHVLPNSDSYESTTTKYKREWVATAQTATESGETLKVVATVDENGVATFIGLPAGTYTLSETVVPNGYNPIPDYSFTIAWTAPTTVTDGTEDCTWTVGTDDDTKDSGISYNSTDNAFEITVVNQKGSTLPETGGIGTTIFYIVGGVLVVAAAVLLITKKRVGAEG